MRKLNSNRRSRPVCPAGKLVATVLLVAASAGAARDSAAETYGSFIWECYGQICASAWSVVQGFPDTCVIRSATVQSLAWGPNLWDDSDVYYAPGYLPCSPGNKVAEVFGFGTCVTVGQYSILADHEFLVSVYVANVGWVEEWVPHSSSFSFTNAGPWEPSC
jgi:hypothetical protein